MNRGLVQQHLETARVLTESAMLAMREGHLEGARRRIESAEEELAFALGALDGKELAGEPIRHVVDPGRSLTSEEEAAVLGFLATEVGKKLRTALFVRAERAGLGMRIDLLPPGPDDDGDCVWGMNAVLNELGWPQRRMADLRGFLEGARGQDGLVEKLGRPADIHASRTRIRVSLGPKPKLPVGEREKSDA